MLSTAAFEAAHRVIGTEDFFSWQHGIIWSAMSTLWDAGIAINPESVARELGRCGELLRIGGAPYLHTLFSVEHMPSLDGQAADAESIGEHAKRRRIVQGGLRLVQLGESGGADRLDDVLAFVRREVEDVEQYRADTPGVPVAELMGEFVGGLDAPLAGVVATPWPEVDDLLLGGLRRGELVVLAARSSTGKTLLALNIARSAARSGVPTAYLSGEMSREELLTRLVADVATVPWSHLTEHRLTDDDRDRVKRASERITEWPLYLDDQMAGASVSDIRTRCRHLVSQGLGLVIVDQLSFIEPADPRAPERVQLDQIARALKNLARALDVPILLLHQLNRGPSDRRDKRPDGDSDIRGTDAIKHHADKVMLAWRPEDKPGEMVLIVDKHRNGPTGSATLRFEGHYARAIPGDPYRV